MQKNIQFETHNDLYYLNQLHRRTYHQDMQPRQLLQNKIISQQSSCLYKPLSHWINATRLSLHKVDQFQDPRQIEEIFHHSIVIFIALENYKYAREICYSQIQTFTHWSNKTKNTDLLKYVFKPWMQLIQINRLEGNLYDACEKLKTLNINDDAEIMIGENKLLTYALHQALHNDPILYNEIYKLSVVEKIHLYLASQRYSELITYTNHLNDMQYFIQEAQVVAYANMGKMKETFRVLKHSVCQNITKNPALLLRELELQLALGFNRLESSTLDFLYQLFMSPDYFTHPVPMILHLAWIMQKTGMSKKAIELAHFCHELTIQSGDEVLKAECLVMLFDWSDSESKKKIEDLMIIHYFNTRYVVARKKMIYCFKDLKFVETQHHDDATLLFEDLLAFNI